MKTFRRGFLFDMDGVLYRGTRAISSGIEFLNEVQRRRIPYLLLTNHSCLTPGGFSAKLKKMGIAVPAGRIYSSSLAAAEWLKEQKIRRVYMVGEEGLRHALRQNGIAIADKAECVVAGLDRKLTYERLTHAFRLIIGGAKFIGTNPDPTYPIQDGPAPECGPVLAAIENCTGVKPLIIGKPEKAIYRFAARRLGVPRKDVTMIGDRLDTDILGAKNAGMRSILVLTGHTTRAMLRGAKVRPGRVVKTLRDAMDELG